MGYDHDPSNIFRLSGDKEKIIVRLAMSGSMFESTYWYAKDIDRMIENLQEIKRKLEE